MTSKSLVCFRRGLAISLMAAAALISAQPGYAVPGRVEQANGGQSSNNPPDVKAMVERAEKLRAEGQFGAAAAIWQEILTNVKKSLGPDHLDVAYTLTTLGELLEKQGKYSAIDPLFRRSLAIRIKSLGPDHPDVAYSLNNLALLLAKRGKYTEAEPLLRRALVINEKAFGSEHPIVARSLHNLALLIKNQGKHSAAETLYRRALAILERATGQDNPDVAQSLNNIALLLIKRGKHIEAEALLRRALAIREKVLGPDNPDVAQSLSSLAELLQNQDKYNAADPLLRRALSIRNKAFGPDHPIVAYSLNNLAVLLMSQGQYSAAEPLFRSSLAIFEKAIGPDNPEVAQSLNNNANLLIRQEKYIEAEPLLRRALAIRERALGLNHPDVAESLSSLAELLHNKNKYNTADPLLRRALAILNKSFGPDHPYVAYSLRNLAAHLVSQGQYSAAESLYLRSLAILKKAIGSDNLDVAKILTSLAELLSINGQYLGAVSALDRSLTIESTWVSRELPLLPDQARYAQLRLLRDTWQLPFTWINRHPPASQLALKSRLNRQGLLQEIEQNQTLLLNTPGIDRAKIEQLQYLTQQLASVTLPPDSRIAVRVQRDKLQAELYGLNPDLRIQLVTPAEVAKSLPQDSVLVEFQRYQPFDERKTKSQRSVEAQYIALVLKPNGSITSVPLGSAAKMEATIHKGLISSAQGLDDAEAIWGQLSIQLLKPLLPHLESSRQWFLSPDDELHRVPFAALPAPQQPSKPLAQVVKVRLITTGRELLRLQKTALVSGPSLVVANPSYNRANSKWAAEVLSHSPPNRGQRRSAEVDSSQWRSLPGSEWEGQQVAQLLSTILVSGTAATTTFLQRQQGPRVLHIATHGFFVADKISSRTDPLRMMQEQAPQLQGLRQGDPQLRSGLVLAGANQPDLDPNDDGYLTAAEAVTLNLKGTELVVLSACSTGQSAVRTGEGVYGLQRSLTVAGARSTLLSLWKVDDAATAEFMIRFYKRLKAGEGRSDALAAVQKEFRDGTAGDGQWKAPYYWAAWQLVGDWRPIPGL